MTDLETQILSYEVCPELFERMYEVLDLWSRMREAVLPRRYYPADKILRAKMASDESPAHFDTLSNALHCANAALYYLGEMENLEVAVKNYNEQNKERPLPEPLVRSVREGYAGERLKEMAEVLWGANYERKRTNNYCGQIKIACHVLGMYVVLKRLETEQRTERKTTLRNIKAQV